jgi:hypothetical protein
MLKPLISYEYFSLLNYIPLACPGSIGIFTALNIFQNKTSFIPFQKGSLRAWWRVKNPPIFIRGVEREVVGISGGHATYYI